MISKDNDLGIDQVRSKFFQGKDDRHEFLFRRCVIHLSLIKSAVHIVYGHMAYCPFVINQNRYSIFDRTVEKNGLKKTTGILKKGLITFSPLAQGQLTDRYLNGIPEDSRIRTDGRFLKESNLTPERLQQIRELNDMAAERGEKLSEMALGWLLAQQEVTSVLIGASRPQQILDNIKAIHCAPFTEEELVRIDEIAAENTASMIMKSQIYPGA